jgi:hypothetical protein
MRQCSIMINVHESLQIIGIWYPSPLCILAMCLVWCSIVAMFPLPATRYRGMPPHTTATHASVPDVTRQTHHTFLCILWQRPPTFFVTCSQIPIGYLRDSHPIKLSMLQNCISYLPPIILHHYSPCLPSLILLTITLPSYLFLLTSILLSISPYLHILT